MTWRQGNRDNAIFSSRDYDLHSPMGQLEEVTWLEIEERAQFYKQGYPSHVLVGWVLEDMRKQGHATLKRFKITVRSDYESGVVLRFEERSAVDRLSEMAG